MHKFLFYNKFIVCFYMFRALCAHHQVDKTVLYNILYHHTKISEWSNFTKIQFYKYGHIVVKFMYELTLNLLILSKHTFMYYKVVYPHNIDTLYSNKGL